MMHHPPAFCPVHGFFPALVLNIPPGATNVTFIGMATDCPVCGAKSEILAGTYEALPDRLNVLLGPSVSTEALNALQEILKKVQRSEITIEEARSQAEKIEPKAAGFFSGWSDGSKALVTAALIGAIGAIIAARVSRAPAQTVIVQPVIERVIENVPRMPPEVRLTKSQAETLRAALNKKPKSGR